MGGTPDPPPPIQPSQVIPQAQQSNLQTSQQSQAQSTIGQNTPIGNLSYTTSIDPITGQPKYQANTQYTPIEQLLLNLTQGQQAGAAGAGLGNIISNFGRYAQDPNQTLLNNTGSLTSNWLDAQNPAWERFMAPQRAQLDTQLRNSGILPGTPAYQQQMDALTQQQLLTKGGALANFQPQAFGEANTALNDPLNWAQKFLTMSAPANLTGSFVNTPQGNVQPVDVAGINIASQQEAFQNYQQQVASQNNLMSMMFGVPLAAMGLRTAGGGSLGGDMLGGMFGGGGMGGGWEEIAPEAAGAAAKAL